jgi:hypothetical protein
MILGLGIGRNILHIIGQLKVITRDSLVSCPINNMAFVAIKMGRRSGHGRTKACYLWDRTQAWS